ncbi:hypothetical protein IGI04_003380, partial [Brassica rapa subsp. trilocularis]
IVTREKIEKREKREKGDLGSGERPARERACRRRSPLSFHASYRVWISSPFLPIASNCGVSVSWREDAVAGLRSRFREVEATTAPPTPALVAERWKFLQLRRLWLKLPGDEALRQRFRKVKKEVGYGGGSKVLWAPAKRGFRWSGTAVW